MTSLPGPGVSAGSQALNAGPLGKCPRGGGPSTMSMKQPISRYQKQYYDLHWSGDLTLSVHEIQRIQGTQKMVPASWKSILDVGCGDGRVSRSLQGDGMEIIGLDWSESSLKHFPGKKIVADINNFWPLSKKVDGAICAEVLEHLPVSQAKKVVAHLHQQVEKGFIISVPAGEDLSTHTVNCPDCGRPYHVWGHVQRFGEFAEVDALVGREATQRSFVPFQGIRPCLTIDRLRRLLGWRPSSAMTICPFCASRLPELPRASGLRWFGLGLLARVESLTNPCRHETGWFICRYDK